MDHHGWRNPKIVPCGIQLQRLYERWSKGGAKLLRTARPSYRDRMEQWLKDTSAAAAPDIGSAPQLTGNPVPPDATLLSAAGLGALAVNLFCAFRLAKFRAHSGSLTRAAFLSARNDALANIAIIAAGFVTIATLSAWPDLIVGLGIFLMNLDAAREVFSAARDEHKNANYVA